MGPMGNWGIWVVKSISYLRQHLVSSESLCQHLSTHTFPMVQPFTLTVAPDVADQKIGINKKASFFVDQID